MAIGFSALLPVQHPVPQERILFYDPKDMKLNWISTGIRRKPGGALAKVNGMVLKTVLLPKLRPYIRNRGVPTRPKLRCSWGYGCLSAS